ncbi:MAG TPA: PQQ-dependent sugar dehydrogenase [Vicinamibacterales bacterium]|nr:PQQ-dependent sugar dehydrogenase [Vicinamibacterales bacterium]
MPDDDFGGPLPDNAHLTGAILRLNDDGSIPGDNPFHQSGQQTGRRIGGALGEEVGLNLQRLYAYGVRNSFGMTFDPVSGVLWTTENGGWIQFMGPLSRVADFKAIELASRVGLNGPTGLQQLRFPAERISDTPGDARKRLFHMPAAQPRDPQFSWKNVVPPAALGFISGGGLGPEYEGDLIVGSAVARATNPGNLYRFRLNGGRTKFRFDDDRLKDTVADNTALDDFTTEGEEILSGTSFGIVTDIQTGPAGALYLVGPVPGEIRKISRP